VDSGRLAAKRTIGGHRRIAPAEVRRLAAAMHPLHLRSTASDWLDTLFAGETQRVRAALLGARQLHGNWAPAADEVASAIVQIGKRWEVGLCKVFEEHCASEILRRACILCAEEMPRSVTAPLAALLTVAGDRHTLGLRLAELVVLETGWRVLWVGEGPPAEELDRFLSAHKPRLVVASASVAAKLKVVGNYQSALIAATQTAGINLVLGGAGAWHPTRAARRTVTFAELRSVTLRIAGRLKRQAKA
jgi:methanogenic corrinoid protein MtbC1